MIKAKLLSAHGIQECVRHMAHTGINSTETVPFWLCDAVERSRSCDYGDVSSLISGSMNFCGSGFYKAVEVIHRRPLIASNQ